MQWHHLMLPMETLVGLVSVYKVQVKVRIVRLHSGEDKVGEENAYFLMIFISYGTVNSLRRNPLRMNRQKVALCWS